MLATTGTCFYAPCPVTWLHMLGFERGAFTEVYQTLPPVPSDMGLAPPGHPISPVSPVAPYVTPALLTW